MPSIHLLIFPPPDLHFSLPLSPLHSLFGAPYLGGLSVGMQSTTWRVVKGKKENQSASSHLLHCSRTPCLSFPRNFPPPFTAASGSFHTSSNGSPHHSKTKILNIALPSCPFQKWFLGCPEFPKIQMLYLFYSSFIAIAALIRPIGHA